VILVALSFRCFAIWVLALPLLFSFVTDVMVNTEYIKLKTPQPSKKKFPRFVGPFQVLERVGRSAYRLQLPAHCRTHPVMHVSKLWLYRHDPSLGHCPPPPIVLENEEYWRVEAVVGMRGKPPRRQF
jgi:hypothetical protein